MTKGEHASEGDLVAWCDGSLDEERRDWLAAHLATCSTCGELLAGFQEVERWLQGQYPLVDDAAARRAIIERLRAEREKGSA